MWKKNNVFLNIQTWKHQDFEKGHTRSPLNYSSFTSLISQIIYKLN